MKAVIISHRFNPGHFSHLVANFKMLVEAEFLVRFCWHTGFDAFSDGEFAGDIVSQADLIHAGKGDVVLVWFPSVAALLDMMLVRVFTKATIVYVFHEPFSSLRSYRDSGFGLLKTAKVALVSLVSYGLVSFSHKIILPSNAAHAAYRAKYNTAKPHAQFPLMFDDEAGMILPKENREYISYIGTVAEDHAFDEFLKFACWVLANGPLDGYKMLIATRSALPPETMARLQPYVTAGTLVIRSGRPLSNEEINAYYARSLVVWNAYRRSMQSGVLPKAYMFGTPVIITSVNRSEFFVDKVTGVEVSSGYDANEILAAVRSIISGFREYSKACRAVFCERFFYRSFAKSFVEFVTSETHGGIA